MQTSTTLLEAFNKTVGSIVNFYFKQWMKKMHDSNTIESEGRFIVQL